ncbi:MAG TPA: hypothetical protein VGL12_15330 [Roseiarcus sp.]
MARMSELGDRLREAADLCDQNQKMTCVGIVAKPNETVVLTYSETEDDPERQVARGIYHGIAADPVDRGYQPFAEDVDEERS